MLKIGAVYQAADGNAYLYLGEKFWVNGRNSWKFGKLWLILDRACNFRKDAVQYGQEFVTKKVENLAINKMSSAIIDDNLEYGDIILESWELIEWLITECTAELYKRQGIINWDWIAGSEYSLIDEFFIECLGEEVKKNTTNKDRPAQRQSKNMSMPEQPKETPEQPKETPEQPKETPEQPKETPEQPKETPEQPKETPEQPKETPERSNSNGEVKSKYSKIEPSIMGSFRSTNIDYSKACKIEEKLEVIELKPGFLYSIKRSGRVPEEVMYLWERNGTSVFMRVHNYMTLLNLVLKTRRKQREPKDINKMELMLMENALGIPNDIIMDDKALLISKSEQLISGDIIEYLYKHSRKAM